MRLFTRRTKRWFRLHVNAPHGVIPWLLWAFDFKGRAEVRAYLAACETRINAALPIEDLQRMEHELVAFGRCMWRTNGDGSTTLISHPYPHADRCE